MLATMVWRAAVLLYTTVTVDCCKRYEVETTTNNKGWRPPHGEILGFDPNASTLFPKRYTLRTESPRPIDGPPPGHPDWNKGWGVPEGMPTPWGQGGINPTPSGQGGEFDDYDPNFPFGFYYDQYGNKIAAEDGQETYIDKDGIERPIKGKPNPYPHGYYYDKDGNKVAAAEGQDYYTDENGIEKSIRGREDPFPHGYYYDEDGNKVAAEEGQDFYYDAQGNKKPVKRDYYPNGYYYNENGNRVHARDGQEYYYDADGVRKPVIKDHGYYFDENGNKVNAKEGQLTYIDKKTGKEKPVRGKPAATENPNPWADDDRIPETWKGLGPGSGGNGPPPHAYMPANYGKPYYCFQPPTKGHCKETLTRYSYNPFLDKCQQFSYSGCGGNENNFLTKARCETECTKIPGPDCDPLAYDSVDLANYMDVGRRRCG